MQTADKFFHVSTDKLQELFDLQSELILERLIHYRPSNIILDKVLAPLKEINNELLMRECQ